MTERQRVEIRSYGLVLDKLERRLFRIDRWRLPVPYGVPLRSFGYLFCALGVLLVLARLPVVGDLLAMLPDPIRFVVIPVLIAWSMTSLEIDGRPPHRLALAALLFKLRPRHYAGLRSCPAPGSRIVPVDSLALAATPEAGCYRAGRVRGPARVLLRYPCRIEPRGGVFGRLRGAEEALGSAKELRISSRAGMRPMLEGRLVSLPKGRALVFEEPQPTEAGAR